MGTYSRISPSNQLTLPTIFPTRGLNSNPRLTGRTNSIAELRRDWMDSSGNPISNVLGNRLSGKKVKNFLLIGLLNAIVKLSM